MGSKTFCSFTSCFLPILLLTVTPIVETKRGTILTASADLIDKEVSRLKNENIECAVAKYDANKLDDLRISGKHKKALACHIQYLKEKSQEDGRVWTSLGDIYLSVGSTKSATLCFKQASKMSGKVDEVKKWHFLGPFVIGKGEVDGDPVAVLGGIDEISKTRYKKGSKFTSELLPNRLVSWAAYKQPNKGTMMNIAPQINWNDLVNSLGSTGIMEWQGWIMGEFAVNDKNVNTLIQCLGVHTVFIDNIPVTGDVYRRSQFKFAVSLTQGIHSISIRLRAKVRQEFYCSIEATSTHFEVLAPDFVPDIYKGYLFSDYISLPVANYHASKYLKNLRVSLSSQNHGMPLKLSQVGDKNLPIAPGQIRPIIFRITAEDDKVLETCQNIDIKVKVSTSEGHEIIPLTLRCRSKGDSFIFTFLDHDGSIQHGAAIEPSSECEDHLCPVLLTLHGTTVPAQNQADSYKRMINGKFVFGFENLWLIAPTRHGAHNWEGPGALTAMAAVEQFSLMTKSKQFVQEASDNHIIFAGHSMGGHGAWHLAVHYPDRALALVSLAGWMKKEEYGDSNLFFRHDIATSHADPQIKAIMEACIAENQVDYHASNLKDFPVLARIGANDRTIHPWFVRRMVRILEEHNVNVTYAELPGKEHWWWDTWETNDGGAVHDKQLRDFSNEHAFVPYMKEGSCETQNEDCQESSSNKYQKQLSEKFTFTVVNPAFGESMRGLQILQQFIPFRTSKIEGERKGDLLYLKTQNVARLKITSPPNRRYVHTEGVNIDGKHFSMADVISIENKENKCLCRETVAEIWQICDECDTYETQGQRGPHNLGPARRIAENDFLIVIGTLGSDDIDKYLQELAVYIANLFFLTADTFVPIIKDHELTENQKRNNNLLILGGPNENAYTSDYLEKIPIKMNEKNEIYFNNCNYTSERTGVLFLAPHAGNKLALVLMGSSKEGLLDIVSLATPTIPPMTRSPFSNMVPDFVITGPTFRAYGPGGYQCIGFWGNNWDLRPELVSCAYC